MPPSKPKPTATKLVQRGWKRLKPERGFLAVMVRHGYKVVVLGTVFWVVMHYLDFLYHDKPEMLELFSRIDWGGILILSFYFFGVLIYELLDQDFSHN